MTTNKVINGKFDTNWTNETLSYMIFMANMWNKEICLKIYGYSFGKHIWDKYINYVSESGTYGAMARIIFELDKENLKLLIDAACTEFDGRNKREA